MLPNYVPWGGLEAYQRKRVAVTNVCGGKNGKKHRIFWWVSMLYLINILVEKGDILPNDARCGGLEAY